ncbi:putative component of toxin-antitoxin plasmid stabilization module [Bradyrhizobium sp. i1.8.4]
MYEAHFVPRGQPGCPFATSPTAFDTGLASSFVQCRTAWTRTIGSRKAVGSGVREIRIRDASGAFRIIYLAALADRILVFHAFQKKMQQTAQRDIELAAKRLKDWKAQQ